MPGHYGQSAMFLDNLTFKVKANQGSRQKIQVRRKVLRDVVLKYESNPFTNKEVIAKVKVFGHIDGLTYEQFKTNMPPFGVCTTSCKEILLCKNV
jgi:hypothetical protein